MGEMAEDALDYAEMDFPSLPKPQVFTKPWNADKWLGDAPKGYWRQGNKSLILIKNMEFQHLFNAVEMIKRGDPEFASRKIYKVLRDELRRREKQL